MMKTISCAFVAVLGLAAIAGCKKKDGGSEGCDQLPAAVDSAMKANEAQMAIMPPEAKKMMEKTTAQLKETVVKRCTADKWSDAAIKCLTNAKAAEDFDKCEGTLT